MSREKSGSEFEFYSFRLSREEGQPPALRGKVLSKKKAVNRRVFWFLLKARERFGDGRAERQRTKGRRQKKERCMLEVKKRRGS